jgi:multiple sugar transport system substrate-binding protein
MTTFNRLALAGVLMGATALPALAKDVHYIMCGDERQAEKDSVAEFMAANPDIKVNLEFLPWGTCSEKAMQMAAAGDPPALAYIGSRFLKQLAKADQILPIELTPEQEAAYQPGILSTVEDGGKRWGFPHAFSNKAMFVNCDLFEQAGLECKVPETWDEMKAAATAIKEKTGVAGIGIAGKDFDNTMHMFLDFMYSNGGTVIDTVTGEVKFDDVPARETLQLYADLVPVMAEGATALERGNLQALFEDNKIGMYVTGPWGMGQHAAKNFKAGPIPHGPSGGSGSILITDSIAVFKGSGVEEEAMKLAAHLTSGKSQYGLDKEWGLPPIQKYEEQGITDLYYNAPEWQLFLATTPTGKPEPMVYNFASLQAVFTNMIQGVLLGEITDIDAAVTEAAEGIKAIQ